MTDDTFNALFKELIRQNILIRNVAINLGYTEKEWSELRDRSAVMAEQEMLGVRDRHGDL